MNLPAKRRQRTPQDMQKLREAIVAFLEPFNPRTCRAVFYHCSNLGLVDKTENECRNTIGGLLRKMRRDETIPFEWIADGTRSVHETRTLGGVSDAVDDMVQTYRRSAHDAADAHVQVWLEKETLASAVAPVTEESDVPLFVTHGYSSITYLYEAAERIREANKPTHIYQLGDFDPSGEDIARRIDTDLRKMSRHDAVTFTRLGITPAQVQQYDLPTRPTKTTDTRAVRFGSDVSVELDALPIDVLQELVRAAIRRHVPDSLVRRVRRLEEKERRHLRRLFEEAP